MAASTLTLEAVKEAIARLKAQGIAPSVRKLREELGTGSFKTILSYMQQVQGEQQEQQLTEAKQGIEKIASEKLEQAVKDIIALALATVEDQASKNNIALVESLTAQTEKAKALLEDNAQLLDQVAELEAKLTQQQQEKDAAIKDLTEQKDAEIKRLNEELQAKTIAYSALEQQLATFSKLFAQPTESTKTAAAAPAKKSRKKATAEKDTAATKAAE